MLIEIKLKHYWLVLGASSEITHVLPKEYRFATLSWTSDKHQVRTVDIFSVHVLLRLHELAKELARGAIVDHWPRKLWLHHFTLLTLSVTLILAHSSESF